MTSRSALDAVLAELRFGAPPPVDAAQRPPPADAHGPFRFGLDFDAPERWPDVPYDTAHPSARHDGASRARIVSVLGEAARTMALRAPGARRLVDAQLQRVLLRTSEQAPGGSASHRLHVGRCLLTNLHRPDPATATRVAMEAVTHEAIHQLLYRTEAANGIFCDLAPTPTFRSPWSGARLPLHSLVHASVVWFGLLALWTELAREPASDADDAHARARMAHCLFGFAFLRDVLDGPGFPASSVEPVVLATLRSMADAARQATRAAEPGTTLRQAMATREAPGWPATLASSLASARA